MLQKTVRLLAYAHRRRVASNATAAPATIISWSRAMQARVRPIDDAVDNKRARLLALRFTTPLQKKKKRN